MHRTIHPFAISAWVKIILFAFFCTFIIVILNAFLPAFSADMLTILIFAIWAIAAISCLIAWFCTKFKKIEVDSESITIKSGIISTKTIFIPYRTITDANIKQNFIEKILGIGTLEINTAGTSNPEAVMNNIRYSDLIYVLEVLKSKEVSKEADDKNEESERIVHKRK